MTGYQTFNSDPTLNFMANRMMADISADELREFAKDITSLDSWIDMSLAAAEHAAATGRHREAGSYFRAAEFFMAPDHPRKTEAFDRFHDHFELAFPEVSKRRKSISYNGGELAVIDLPAKGKQKDTILACSGFDGLIEEMYVIMQELANNGYRVVIYEGPGQGAALRRHHLPMPVDWETPVSKILDELDIKSCTLLGLSLGGYLAPRAAAFEPRAKRVIAWGANFRMTDGFKARMGNEAFDGLMKLMDEEQDGIVNQMIGGLMAADATSRWSITHGIHTCGGETPYDFVKWAREIHLQDVSEQITQDSLILHGSRDHLVPIGQVWIQAAALTNAQSITTRIFTEYENASEHCQVTNAAPVLQEILNWLDAIRARDESMGKAQ